MVTANPTRLAWLALLVALVGSAAGCAAVEGIFKAGMWVGVIGVVLVLGLVFLVFSRLTGR